MKKSEAVSKTLEFIQKYNDCLLDEDVAKELVEFFHEELEMAPPKAYVEKIRNFEGSVITWKTEERV